MVVAGESGTGKTEACRALVRPFNPAAAYNSIRVYDWAAGLEANNRIHVSNRESVPLDPKI